MTRCGVGEVLESQIIVLQIVVMPSYHRKHFLEVVPDSSKFVRAKDTEKIS